MAKNTRMMDWVLEESAKVDVDMPWTRGKRSASWKNRLVGEALELDYTELKSA